MESAESAIKECAAEKGDFQLLGKTDRVTYVCVRHSITSLVDKNTLGNKTGSTMQSLQLQQTEVMRAVDRSRHTMTL